MNKKNLIAFYMLSFTWGILWTLIGLIIALVAVLVNYKHIRVSTFLGRIKIVITNKTFGGINLGIIYIVDKYDELGTNIHEVGHSVQNIILGPLFIPLVAIPSGIRYQLFDWLDSRHYKKHGVYLDYYSIWFEKQATNFGTRLFYKK